PGFHKKIGIYERVLEESPERKEFLKFVEKLQFEDLWREKPKKYVRAKNVGIGETARQIIGLVPDAIDLVRSRYGETLRFRGLPFVRVRKIFEEERVLFGVEGKNQRILDEESLPDFERLLNDLLEHRRADTPAKNNSLFRAAPESWLESILRRDVSALDPNLILAPLHAQFRVSQKQGSLDLLALRSDGRLVVIELKVSPDREHVFQGANYWRQIELQRRRGNLQRARLFNDLEIADAAPLVYLCAPLMSFHRDLEILAKTILPDIEIWRFDLNEDWRSGVHVARRQRIN
ncbi:MAG TPA: hypothetical protein VEX64_02365, partial [Pyrinomonadaceae bacterium]|nr:hypothetical protein [Pyrinomonadaceae bacterium]